MRGPARVVLDLLFPPRCLACRRLGSFLCPACARQIRPWPGPFCPTCRSPVDPDAARCRCGAPPLAYVVAAGEFEDPLRAAIHRFKYQGQSAGAAALAAQLLPHVAGLLRPDHLLVPIPLHPRRERQRGYNQAALLAREVARQCRTGVVAGALRRTRFTLPQVELNAARRAANMDGAFSADPAICRGHTIMLIDDVCTTGATLQAGARACRTAGARQVYAAVLATALIGRDRR